MFDNVFTFNTTKELLEQAKEDGACPKALRWCKGKSLDEIFRRVPLDWRLWALKHGYIQFAENCDWKKLDTIELYWLLTYQPQLAKYLSSSQSKEQ